MSGGPTGSGAAVPAGVPTEHRHGGNLRGANIINDPHQFPAQKYSDNDRPDAGRYRGLPVVFVGDAGGGSRPCPFLMSMDDVVAFFRHHESMTKFPAKTVERYRRLGLRTVRVGRRRWFALPDVLDFLDRQQDRLDRMP